MLQDRGRGVLDLHLRCWQEGDGAIKDDIDDSRCEDFTVEINANAAVLCLPPVEDVVEGPARDKACYSTRDRVAN